MCKKSYNTTLDSYTFLQCRIYEYSESAQRARDRLHAICDLLSYIFGKAAVWRSVILDAYPPKYLRHNSFYCDDLIDGPRQQQKM